MDTISPSRSMGSRPAHSAAAREAESWGGGPHATSDDGRQDARDSSLPPQRTSDDGCQDARDDRRHPRRLRARRDALEERRQQPVRRHGVEDARLQWTVGGADGSMAVGGETRRPETPASHKMIATIQAPLPPPPLPYLYSTLVWSTM